MTSTTNLLLKNFIILLFFVIMLLVFRRADLISSFTFGYLTALLNFVFLQVSVKEIFSPSPDKNIYSKVFSYLLRFFLKFVIIALLLIVSIKYMHLAWFGLLLGLIVSTFMHMTVMLRTNKCQSSPNP